MKMPEDHSADKDRADENEEEIEKQEIEKQKRKNPRKKASDRPGGLNGPPKRSPRPVNSQDIEKFRNLLFLAEDSLYQAARLLVAMIDRDAATKRKIINRCPQVTMKFLDRLEKVGREELHPQLIARDITAWKELEALPLPMQERVVEEGRVPLVVPGEDGEPVTVRKDYRKLTRKEARRVFAGDRLRTVEEQREVLAKQSREEAALHAASKPLLPWELIDGGLRVRVNGRDPILTRKQVLTIMQELMEAGE